MIQPPLEPILELDDIQGIAIPGFFKPSQHLIYCRFDGTPATVAVFKSLLRRQLISSGRDALADRRAKRAGRTLTDTTLCAFGVSAQGLAKLTPGASYVGGPAFQSGLVKRSSLLGECAGSYDSGNPINWLVGSPGRELDAIFIVAGNFQQPVKSRAVQIAEILDQRGIEVELEEGNARTGSERGREHFGFSDGVSQPGIRGRASASVTDFVTERYIDSSEVPQSWLYGYPGQDLVWPGEFVLGYPASSPVPSLPGPNSIAEPLWTRNGSFLVYRRLRQNVAAFWTTMREQARQLNNHPAFATLTDLELASKLVGRWPDGTPVSRYQQQTLIPSGLGDDALANNNFVFDSDTRALALKSGRRERYVQAKADPIGFKCPLAAHIRKVNTRDSSSDMGGSSSTLERRILRVGLPYGNFIQDKYNDDGCDRGLLFLAIQANIENQFEFLQSRWINDPARPKQPSGHDMIVGQNQATSDGVRRCVVFGSDGHAATVEAAQSFVTPTGGGYFFIPSLSAIQEVLAQ